jgi:phage protein U
MNAVMMNLGGYSFEIATTPYQELMRQSGWNWPEQELIGSTPAMQFTGRTADKISLKGMMIPGFTGGRLTVEILRLLGDLGLPLPLVSGTGFFLGLWVLESVEHTEDIHFSDGSPRRMTFSVGLKRYADSITALKSAVSAIKKIPQLFS